MTRRSFQHLDSELFDWVETSSSDYLSPGTTDEGSTSSLTLPESEAKMKKPENLYVDPTEPGVLSGFPSQLDSR